ncbi:MAG: hypothetical protein HYX67_14990 [Candidatus Melainabacteria bacterium]|nr:hypothetical protein [Candidatus Melainabacteria bacterium]
MSSNKHTSKRAIQGSSELLSAAPLALLVVLYGVIISSYTVVVHQFTARGTAEECVKRAALLAAARLGQVAVEDPVFGRVGLCDVDNDSNPARRITSLNSIYATLRLNYLLARRLSLPYVDQLIYDDIKRTARPLPSNAGCTTTSTS